MNQNNLVFDIYLETAKNLKKVKTVETLKEAKEYCYERNDRINVVKNDEYYYFLSKKKGKNYENEK